MAVATLEADSEVDMFTGQMHSENDYQILKKCMPLKIRTYYLLSKGGYVFGSVGLSVCLSVCGQHYSKSYERIGMRLIFLWRGPG